MSEQSLSEVVREYIEMYEVGRHIAVVVNAEWLDSLVTQIEALEAERDKLREWIKAGARPVEDVLADGYAVHKLKTERDELQRRIDLAKSTLTPTVKSVDATWRALEGLEP